MGLHHLGTTLSSRLRLFTMALAALCAGCADVGAASCGSGFRAMVAEHLYLGRAMPHGEVSAQAWQTFLDTEVSPRFPQGFSVWPVVGQWRSSSGAVVREPSHVLNIVHEDTPSMRESIGHIVQAYKMRFQQEAVLRVQMPACVTL